MTEREKNKTKEIESNINSDLKNQILNICEPMCLKISRDKPKNIVQHMLKFLRNNYNYSSSLLHNDQKKELSQLKKDLKFFHEQEENFFFMETYHKLRKEGKSPDKKNKAYLKQRQRLPPDELIPSDDEDYNDPDEIDTRLDDINYIKENANQEIRPDYFEINSPNEKKDIVKNEKSEDVFELLKINLIKSPLFSELPFDILKKCIDAMTKDNYKAMSEIVKQGDYSDNFYFVLDGELECRMGFTKIKKEGNRTKVEKFDPKLVKVYYSGDYFCELNLLYHMPIRASIKAITDTTLLILDRKTYKQILNSSFIEKTNNRIELFKKMPIFETLLDEEFEKLSKIYKEKIYYKGETIIKENEYMNVLMIIEEGKCTGYKMFEKGKIPKKIREYKEEDFIGKAALLKEELSEETIKTTSNIVKLICFDRQTIKNVFGSFEQILMRDVEVYEKYFPPIPEYSEQDIMKDTKSQILSVEGDNIPQNSTKNLFIEESTKRINKIDKNDNLNNINNNNIQSRNTEKQSIKPEKINSLSYGIDEISKRASKEKEEMYESEIKRLKEEVSLLKNKLSNRTYPELNHDNFNENENVNLSNLKYKEKEIEQNKSEKEIISSEINNIMISNQVNNDNIINNENNVNNEEINNNFINNKLSENINISQNNQNDYNEEKISNKEEFIKNLVNFENNNNEVNKSNNELQEKLKKEEIEKNAAELENVNRENYESNNFTNNINVEIGEKIEDKNIINNNTNNNNNNSNSLNNSKKNEKINNSQTSFKENRVMNINKFKNLKNLNIDDMNSSIHKRSVANKSIKNFDEFQIDSNNSIKNKKINSEKNINKVDSKRYN